MNEDGGFMTEIVAAFLGAVVGFGGSWIIMREQFKAAKEKDLEDKKLAKNKEINHFCILFNDGYKLLLSLKSLGHWNYEKSTYNEKLKIFCDIHKNKDIANALDYVILTMMEDLSIEIQDKLLPLLNKDDDMSEILKYLNGSTFEKLTSLETKLIDLYGEEIPSIRLIFNTSYKHMIL